jgi:ArsR family transcriptional regulator, arsenate/arsenite/antimonite-responsive transcriptional repressor
MAKKITKHHEELALKIKALSHPARLEILKLLKEKECLCGEIVDLLPLAQATVSQHLRVLKEAGFIFADINGTTVCYTLNHTAIEKFKQAVQDI